MKRPKIKVGVTSARTTLVCDHDYFPTLSAMVRQAYRRVSASIFIVDMNPDGEDFARIHALFVELKNAMWEGCDVRLIISGSKTNMQIAQAAMTSHQMALSMGLRSVTPMASDAELSHAKYVVADDYVLLGSHNWSPDDEDHQSQDSVLIRSAAYASYCRHTFDQQWKRIAR